MEISYMFLPEHWGKGYAQEAIKAILCFCEQKLNLNRVVSETQTANLRSCRLLETLGYRAESQIERFGAKQTINISFITPDVLRLRAFYEAVFDGKAEGDETHSTLEINGVYFVFLTQKLRRFITNTQTV